MRAAAKRIGGLLEVLLIVAWAIWVGREYLNMDPQLWPQGGDFPLTVQSYFVWQYLPQCGTCVFWNGFVNGGNPAFVEPHGAFLHPLVIITTLVWGVVNGSKVTLIASLALAGLAQWWLAKVMRLGLFPRLWAAGLVVVGGHLAGRMEIGLVGIILSTAFGSLALAPALRLGQEGRRRDAVLLGVFTALTLLSGQGYIQISLALTLLIAVLVFSFSRELSIRPVFKEFLLAGLIAVLLSAVFWVPFLHFLPNFAKDIDTTLSFSQPLEYQPLNLVIHDLSFFQSDALEKIPFPAIYMNYIGWAAVILALVGIFEAGRRSARLLAFLFLPVVSLYLLSSRQVILWLAESFPDLAMQTRYPSLIIGLAVPLILGLAAYGLEQVLTPSWLVELSQQVKRMGGRSASLLLYRLLVLALLGFGIKSAYDFNQGWLILLDMPDDIPLVVQHFQTANSEWVQPPLEHFWYPYLFERGMKGVAILRPWHWKKRISPPAQIVAVRSVEEAIPSDVQLGQIYISFHPEQEYATVTSNQLKSVCQAEATGGLIEVACENDFAGWLTVRENQITGWRAEMDGREIAFEPDTWLKVPAPAGVHRYFFRYRPWDAPLGLLLTLAGILFSAWVWIRASKGAPQTR